MTPRRSSRLASERLESEGDADCVPQAETTTIRVKKGQPATNSSPGKRKTITFRRAKSTTTSPIPENDLEEENASLGERKIRTFPKSAEKRSLQVSNAADPAPKRLKYDEGFQNLVQALEDMHYRLKRQLRRSTGKIIDLELSVEDQEVEVAALQDERSMLSKQVGNLEAEVARLRDSNKSIQVKCRELEKDRDEIQQNAIQALDNAKIHHPDELSTVSMDVIDKEWRHLIYSIHDLVVRNLTATPISDDITNLLPEINRIIRGVEENSELQVPLLERHIWQDLQSAVFKENSKLWDGGVETNFVKNVRDLRAQRGPSAMTVMKFRAAGIIISGLGANETLKLQYVQRLSKHLEPFTERPISTKLREDLALVFDSAINIMRLFIKSRDIYEFGSFFNRPAREKIAYDERVMKISSCLNVPNGLYTSQPAKFAVEVIHSPPLFIISTTEGEYFGRKELVCPANVTVRKEEVSNDDTEESEGPKKKISDEASIIVS
ncbi:hypothetical protein J3458_004648 [Metarhizium acridum]|uniref:uncharacterized protein n=1 Tax=Metarhizium acridum TaxID=92637 RepID=UPI001C6B262C|nr:hypothetical protein J3458_004648 [Metarhizium acridum]